MGVDFYTCQNDDCRETFCDAGYYFSCYCGYHYCSNECGARQYDEDDEDKSSCIRCRREFIDDGELVHFLLGKLGLTREAAVLMLKEESKE